MNQSLHDELVEMDAHDQAVRAILASDGTLFEGYHPQMAEIHRKNASRLHEIIIEYGWPGIKLAGEAGAFSAWRIAQHAIGEPHFMRHCRDLIEAAGRYGDAPQWQFAFMDDRIRTFEGRPQRYGTQLRFGSDGLEPCPIENEMQVDILRKELGLPNLSDVLEQVRANPPSNPTDQSAKEEAEMKWRREVGWLENVVR